MPRLIRIGDAFPNVDAIAKLEPPTRRDTTIRREGDPPAPRQSGAGRLDAPGPGAGFSGSVVGWRGSDRSRGR